MLKLGKIKLGNSPKIVATIDNIHPQTIKRAKRDGAQILELRLDKFKRIDTCVVLDSIKIIKAQNMSLIATIRSKKEGGTSFIPNRVRLQLFKTIISHVDAIDIELSSNSILDYVIRFAHKLNKLVIVSYHNFKFTPSKGTLNRIIKSAKKRKADIVKISTLAKSVADVLTLGDVTIRNKRKNMITIAMGMKGKISRIFLPMCGSLVTYGFVDRIHASGQIQVGILKRDLKIYQ